jgi:hypothetical protein
MIISEHQQEVIAGHLAASCANHSNVTLTLREGRQITGIVSGLDKRRSLVKLDLPAGWRLLALADIVAVDFGGC